MTDELPDLEVKRANGVIEVRWAGSPRFKAAIPDIASQKAALMQLAESMETDARRHSGAAQREIQACIRHLRMRAAAEP
jgi:hypothetical protein